MEEARQHPPVSLLGWAGIASLSTFLVAAIAMVFAALFGLGRTVVPFVVPVFAGAAVAMLALSIRNAFRLGMVRTGSLAISRQARPIAFWTVATFMAIPLVGFAFAFLVSVGGVE